MPDGLSGLLSQPAALGPQTLPREAPNRPLGQDGFADIGDILLGLLGVKDQSDPRSSRATGVGNLMGAALPLAKLRKMAMVKQLATGEQAAEEIPAGIRAYHGSPHDFDQFSSQQIGTGEGAQAFGHGLYFAEKEGTARSYRDALSSVTDSPQYAASQRAKQALTDATLADFKASTPATAAALKHAHAEARAAEQAAVAAPRGKMYEVNIHAKPEEFLDWDRPYAEQPEALRRMLGPRYVGNEAMTPATGKDAYRAVAKDPKEASQLLEGAGVKGIRYRDAGSRGAETGTSNYVAFNDKIVEMLRKYGLLAPLAGGAAMAGQQQQPSVIGQ
jgi:hypothetical protein